MHEQSSPEPQEERAVDPKVETSFQDASEDASRLGMVKYLKDRLHELYGEKFDAKVIARGLVLDEIRDMQVLREIKQELDNEAL